MDLSTLDPPRLRSLPVPEPPEGLETEPLADRVPADFYYMRFRSVDALDRFLDEWERWSGHFLKVYEVTARDSALRGRMERMLAVRIDETLRPMYGVVIREMALTGSDLFVREGSDLTLMFHVRERALFEEGMRAGWDKVLEMRPEAKVEEAMSGEIALRGLVTPDRSVCSWRAELGEFAFVSNSQAALERVLAAAAGKSEALGKTREFRHMRTIFPPRDRGEDGFAYLSDPFLRRMVGPELRIAEARRVRCVNALRMVANARLLHRIDTGKDAGLEALISAGYLRKDDLHCPSGGALAADPRCSVHGTLVFLTPCLEVPVGKATPGEAHEYGAFAREYDRLWRRYFDPVGIRMAAREGLRLEVCVLPLGENSLYRTLERSAGGVPAEFPWDLPEGAIFALGLKVGDPGSWVPENLAAILRRDHGIEAPKALREAFRGAPVLLLFDAPLLFDYDLAGFFGEAASWEQGRDLSLLPLLSAANLPAGLVVPVADQEAARRFLSDLRGALAREAARVPGGRFTFRFEGYELPGEEGASVLAVEFFAFRVRIFHVLEEGRLLLATREEVLRAMRKAPRPGATLRTNVAVRMEPARWSRIRGDMELSYEESARRACLKNLAPLGALAAAFSREPAALEPEGRVLFGERFFCPDGGEYRRGPGEAGVVCTLHGSRSSPRQLRSPASATDFGEALRSIRTVEAALSFTREGLLARFEVR